MIEQIREDVYITLVASMIYLESPTWSALLHCDGVESRIEPFPESLELSTFKKKFNKY